MPKPDTPHLFVPTTPERLDYTAQGGGDNKLARPTRPDREAHARRLATALKAAVEADAKVAQSRREAGAPARSGTYLNVDGVTGYDLVHESLEARASGIRLLNVREANGEQAADQALVYVPEGKSAILARKIERYQATAEQGPKARNAKLLDSVEAIRTAVIDSFWTDPAIAPPVGAAAWCEVWLRIPPSEDEAGADEPAAADRLTALCRHLELPVREGGLRFPERFVKLVQTDTAGLTDLIAASDDIAEFRGGRAVNGVLLGEPNAAQVEWVDDLAGRIRVADDTDAYVCIVDTGANNAHPLIAPLLADADTHTVEPAWGPADNHGHGTLMCGIAAYGDTLGDNLQHTGELVIEHRLESSKILRAPGETTDQQLYGLRTREAVTRVEITAPGRNRVFCMAVTTTEGQDRGRPTSWSGALDALAAGVDGGDPRLFIVAGGNVGNPADWLLAPTSNETASVHDPAQAWNALAVGAINHRDQIDDPTLAAHFVPSSAPGELSPYSSTSLVWSRPWPNKPDIVMEGGTPGRNENQFANPFCEPLDDLSLLSTHHEPQIAQLAAHNMTSAATALAAEMAVRLRAAYPEAWPETIRGLMVHSARWPDALRAQFQQPGDTVKATLARLLRIAGYGEPDMARAFASARDSLTLIAQETLQPFTTKIEVKDGKRTKKHATKDMHLHALPWPQQALDDLPDEAEVRIDVTLSYFVEPGPGEIGWSDKYRYRSHGLAFNLNKPTETARAFAKRINVAARTDGEEAGGKSIPWVIGPARSRGSVQKDWVILSAADARNMRFIGVYPEIGWWRSRPHLGRVESRARYSLIVSLSTDAQTVDLYTPIAQQIAARAAIGVVT